MADDSQWIVETKDLTRRFGDVVAVRNLNVRIAAGEIFGLIGPDGAGKTTTIRLLAAIMDPSSGEARVAGYDTRKQPEPIKRRIGYMAQRFNLYGDLSVWENLHFFADVFEVHGPERQARIARLLHFARLDAFRDRRAANLSGGMQKKLALACTLVHRPEILLLDEPTTGVDPVSRREFWNILTDLHLQGITLIVSTPYMDEAERCSRVGLLYRGRLITCDTPEKVKAVTAGHLIALWPANVRRARSILADLDGQGQVEVFGDQLRIFTTDIEATMKQARALLDEAGVEILDMRPGQPRLEEAYISLVSSQNREAET